MYKIKHWGVCGNTFCENIRVGTQKHPPRNLSRKKTEDAKLCYQ
jgi:hypothetical protein